PLFGGTTEVELLSTLLEQGHRETYDLLRDLWRKRHAGGDAEFEAFWQAAVQRGLVAGSAAPTIVANIDWSALEAGLPRAASTAGAAAAGLELQRLPDPKGYDGRFAHNGWLQELPRPLRQLTWDNAVLIAPHTADRLGLASGDMVELSANQHTLRAPIMLAPGRAEDSLGIALGYGRSGVAETVAMGVGVNAYPLRTTAAPWILRGVALHKV